MAIFEKAERDASSNQYLKAGQLYFIDQDEDDIFSSDEELVEEIAKLFPRESWIQVLKSGRGQVMMTIRPKKDTVVPQKLGKLLGFFYILPKGTSLAQAQNKLYGSTFNQPTNFWDYMAAEHPATLNTMLETAEDVVATGKEITSSAQNIAKTIVIGCVAVVGTMVLYRALKK